MIYCLVLCVDSYAPYMCFCVLFIKLLLCFCVSFIMHLMPPSWAAPHELDLPGNKSNTWHTMWNFNLINENLDQGSRKCRQRLIGQTTQTYAVLSRNSICRDLRTFSGVIFPSFDANSYICHIYRPEKLSIEQNSY